MATNKNDKKLENTLKNQLEYKDITSFYKVKFDDPINIDDFQKLEKILDDESNPKYHSRTAETRRLIQKQKIIKLKYKKADRYIEIFKILCNSYLYNIEKNLDFETVKLLEFYYDEKNRKFYKIDIFNKEYFKTIKMDKDNKIAIPFHFSIKFISQDIVYKNEYELIFPTKSIFLNSKNNYYQYFKVAKIKILRTMKTPFPLELYSIKSIMVRRDFSKQFKNYILQIEKGINKELYKKNDN